MKKKLRGIILFLLITVVSFGCNTSKVFAESTVPFDTVLMLDVSGSMGSHMYDMCLSAKDFCKQVKDLNSENTIAIIAFDSNAYMVCEPTTDIDQIYYAIDSLEAGGSTAMYAAIELVYDTITSVSSVHDIKNVIIMADGIPNIGPTAWNGRYDALFPELATYYDLGYENSVYNYTTAYLHPIANVYTVGFFDFNSADWDILSDEERLSVQLMKDLANTNSFFPQSAEEMFSDVGNAIVSDAVTEPPSTTVLTTVPETEATTEAITENVTLDLSQGGTSDGMSTGTKVAIGTIATGGIGGLIALIIYLLTRTPKTPIAPIAAPVILPVDDDDDTDNPINDPYRTPRGIENFAHDAGAADFNEPFVPLKTATIFGVSGLYRDSAFSIGKNEVIRIGRDPQRCSIVITEDVAKVSRVHCAVQYNEATDRFIVTDLSKNGTFTKNNRLQYDVPTELPKGTEIQLADSTNIFRLG